jgi:hypothetical protein
VDFSALKRKNRLPPPPDDFSDNLSAPEHAPAAALPNPSPTSALAPAGGTAPSLPGEHGEVTGPGKRTMSRVVRPYVPAPPVEALDGRSRLRTGRTEPFSTRVRADFRARLIRLADHQGCTMAEALEIAVERMERELGLS